ncbi:MAG: Ig-like domain-containing protein [Mycobacterium sp.]
MAGGHRLPKGTKTNRSGGNGRRGNHRAKSTRPEPYAWLGASAVTLGLGAALAGGTGVAYADDGGGSVSSNHSPSSTGQDSPGAVDQSSSTAPDVTPKAEDPADIDPDDEDTGLIGSGAEEEAGTAKKPTRGAHVRGTKSVLQNRLSTTTTNEIAETSKITIAADVGNSLEAGSLEAGAPATPEVTSTLNATTAQSASSRSALATSSAANLAAADEPAPAPVPKAIAVPVLKFVGGILNLFGVNTNSPLPQLDLGLAAAWTWFRQLQTEWGIAPPTAVVATSTEPDPETGTVTGFLNANNPSGLALTYTVAIDPLLGSVTVAADGAFSYTPSEAARLAAIIAPLSDIFTVTVSNGIASNYSLVTVPIGATTAGTPGIPATVSQSTNTTTGLVTGQVGSTGPAGHTLTYQVLTSTLGGQLTFDNATGEYTYQPSALAMALAGLGIGPVSDVFTVVAKNGSLTSLPGIITVPIAAGNATPSTPASISQSVDPLTGLVTGQVGSTDPSGQNLTYDVLTGTLGGTLNFNDATGEYTYQPSALAMALAGAGLGSVSDVFTVTASNGTFTSMPTIITVPITAANAKPGTPVGGSQSTNAATGVVTGSVSSTDPLGAGVTYTVITSTVAGTLNFNGATGTYTYTPSAAARAAASAGITTPDVFTVTATNAAGTSSFAAITVPIAPNPAQPSAPSKGSHTINTSNGLVTSSVSATDPGGLPLTYNVTIGAISGSVSMNPNGTFTYLPTSAARRASYIADLAGDPLSDVFTVTVSNGYSSNFAIITVPISPKF